MDGEKRVRAFLDTAVAGDVDASTACFANGASYRLNAWSDALVGVDAIRHDFERQRALWSNFRYEVLKLATVDNVVFAERVDTVHMAGRDVTIHVTGVFEFDDAGKISNWREYFDMKEIEAQFAA